MSRSVFAVTGGNYHASTTVEHVAADIVDIRSIDVP